MELSKKSRDFLDDLSVYLMSSGKSETEVKDIVFELKDHLLEAEQAGKDVDDVIGQSPKSYMQYIGHEMAFDMNEFIKVIVMMISNLFAYIIIGNFIEGEMTFSTIQMIGFPLVAILFLLAASQAFRTMAVRSKESKFKNGVTYVVLAAIPMLSFLGLMVLDIFIETPTVVFGPVGQLVLFGIGVITLLIVSVWTKTWINLIIPILLFGPQYAFARTSLPLEQQLIFSMLIFFIGMAIFFLVWAKKNKENQV
ncbi:MULTISPECIES: DUF1129 family protein [unclassified Exiguobacterium]|uniref:DUF1129 family protein n=1 Tax=unclassified Exiguobacterium TaxID=2644629 RepID=UPI001BEA8578|nr:MULTISPECIES: DUF1129 family protein [unclassified Exiguobacterium]